MAQTARIKPLPGTGKTGGEDADWMHDLTPTLSDQAMFDDAGRVQPLRVWPNESEQESSRAKLTLVRKEKTTEVKKQS